MKYYEQLKTALFKTMDLVGTGEVKKSDSWVQLVTRPAKTHYRNGIYYSNITTDLDSKINETIDFYKNIECPFRWIISPDTKPENTKEALESKGFKHFENLVGVSLTPEEFTFSEVSNSKIEVKEVDINDPEEWVDVTVSGWEIPESGRVRFLNEVKSEATKKEQECFYFTAYIDGKPCGTSSYLVIDDFIHLNGSVVLPEFRKNGVYRAMLNKRIQKVKDEGYSLVTIHCVESTSAPICLKLGFKQECLFEVMTFENI